MTRSKIQNWRGDKKSKIEKTINFRIKRNCYSKHCTLSDKPCFSEKSALVRETIRHQILLAPTVAEITETR